MKNIKSLYVAHPIYERHAVREWELGFEERTGIQLFNPFYDDPKGRDDIKRMDQGEDIRYSRDMMQCLSIVGRDLHHIAKQDGIVAFLEKEQNSVGTPMEIFYNSHMLRKPTYVISETLEGHPWIKTLSTKIFSSEPDFEQYIWTTQLK